MARTKICANCKHDMRRHDSTGCWMPKCNCSRKGSTKDKPMKGLW